MKPSQIGAKWKTDGGSDGVLEGWNRKTGGTSGTTGTTETDRNRREVSSFNQINFKEQSCHVQ